MHILGAVYAPTAAFAFSGKDNAASFVTDGIVARHVSAVRWTDPGSTEIPAFGGGSGRPRLPRSVVLEAKDPSGKVIARTDVTLADVPAGTSLTGATSSGWRRGP